MGGAYLLFGTWYLVFPQVQIYNLADKQIGILDDWGKTNPLPTDKGIVSPLVLNG